MSIEQITKEVIELSKQVGSYLLEERKHFDPSKIEEKSFNNLVSYVDKTAEDQFKKGLAKIIPEAGFIAEESEDLFRKERFNWVIDPLDGTTNYIFGLPIYCTSVGLLDHDELILGVIFDPNRDECFSASKGNGAFLNDRPIQVSSSDELIRSLIATGFPYDDFKRFDEYVDFLGELTKKTKGLRRLGSAALDLAYVACGRFDAFYEYGLNAWDVAAGAIIVKEAGGLVTDFKNGKDFVFGEEILASNPNIHEEMHQALSTHF